MSQEKKQIPTPEQVFAIFVKFDGKPRKRFEYLVRMWMHLWCGLSLLHERNESENVLPDIQLVKKEIKETKFEINQIREMLYKIYSHGQVNQLFHQLAVQAQHEYGEKKIDF